MATGKELSKQLESLGRRDILAYGITYIDLLGREWELGNRQWMPEIYNSVNPWIIEKYPAGQARRMTVMKPTQIGMSTMGIVRLLHFADNWTVRTMYTLPRQVDVLDFTTTRLDPTIKSSPRLRDKLGNPDSAHAKALGTSYIYITEMTVEPRMLPIDALFIDEVDLSDPNNIGTAFNRLDASRWKLSYFFSTPTLPNFGIHAMYETSDKRRWVVKCPGCNTDQVLDWDENLRLEGSQQNPSRVYFGCSSCNKELTMDIIQTAGQWVAEKPDLSSEHIGFHLSQMMTHSPTELYTRFRDPQTKLLEFYRKSLGKPYEISGGSLERDDFLVNCFDYPYKEDKASDGRSRYFMGIDQGNELQVLVAKLEPDNPDMPKIVHIERIPMERGFDRAAQLMDIYKIKTAVVDANPNRHNATKFAKDFPGRVLLADYIEQQKETSVVRKDKKLNVRMFITINRTGGFDSLIEDIRSGRWKLPGFPPNLSQDVEMVIDQVTALKRDYESRKTLSGETQVAVWRAIRPDHFGHSWLYLRFAMESQKGGHGKIAVVGNTEEENLEEAEESYKPSEETIKEITSILAEVPKEQLQAFFDSNAVMETIPFPLSHKLKQVPDGITTEDILWTVLDMLNDKPKKPIY